MAWFMGMIGISISLLVLGKLEAIHKDIKALKEQDTLGSQEPTGTPTIPKL